MTALLFTQSLQNDFVKPIGRFDSLPNLLHIGHEESRRLLGENPHEGPIARLMEWAYAQDDETLKLIHVRDWHDATDPNQQDHLRQFGPHCLKESDGAKFVFAIPAQTKKITPIINSLTLNDFVGTTLTETLKPYAQQKLRVGLVGVWTEAKIQYLAYDLCSRYPQFQIAVCSALTASSSRAQHFMALDQLSKILGVKVFASVAEFTEFLTGQSQQGLISLDYSAEHPVINWKKARDITPTDEKLIRYLFRDCQKLTLNCLDGGFSGNLVLGTQSIDLLGHEQVPHVVKIGASDQIGRERSAFERIESVLGNSAPRIADFADFENRGAIKYRYASMGGGFSTTFQKKYVSGLPLEKICKILDTVFHDQLGRFYAAATLERLNLLDYYLFSSKWAPNVRSRVEKILGKKADGPSLAFDPSTKLGSLEPKYHDGSTLSECNESNGLAQDGNSGACSQVLHNQTTFPNICLFYEKILDELPKQDGDSAFMSYVHGDLNGANIIIDAQENTWLIDFFHTHRGHVLKDLIKLENDLLYIFTPVTNASEFADALKLTDALIAIEDLGVPLPDLDPSTFKHPQFLRAWQTIQHLRTFYPPLIKSDRDPLQAFIGQMRYAVHTLSFDESNDWQKKWALYAAGKLSDQVAQRLKNSGRLRVDWLENQPIGLTLLPGRKDYGRDLTADIQSLTAQGITNVVCLLSPTEFAHYGVEPLLKDYQQAGFHVYTLPILDQAIPSANEVKTCLDWIKKHTSDQNKTVIHCVGGLGRSGLIAACYLKSQGMTADAAIQAVRKSRSPRAIETKIQEDFVRQYPAL